MSEDERKSPSISPVWLGLIVIVLMVLPSLVFAFQRYTLFSENDIKVVRSSYAMWNPIMDWPRLLLGLGGEIHVYYEERLIFSHYEEDFPLAIPPVTAEKEDEGIILTSTYYGEPRSYRVPIPPDEE